jgi:hypothetical protein
VTHRSAHGIKASPEQVKHTASPNNPVASPTSATGPSNKSHVKRFWNKISVDDHTSRNSSQDKKRMVTVRDEMV